MSPPPVSRGRLLAPLPDAGAGEVFETLAGAPVTPGGAVRVERIVSAGQVSPPGFWYDQDEHEWVAVLAGEASLEVEGEPAPLVLAAGDWVLLPAHRRHRVLATAVPTVWLAVFWS